MVEVLEGDCIHHLRSLCEAEEQFPLVHTKRRAVPQTAIADSAAPAYHPLFHEPRRPGTGPVCGNRNDGSCGGAAGTPRRADRERSAQRRDDTLAIGGAETCRLDRQVATLLPLHAESG